MHKRPTRKVFIPNKGGHNYEPAAEFGTLVYVTEGTLNRFSTTNMYRAFIEAMEDSSPDDYYIPTSLNVISCIGAAVFARKHGRLNLLLYRQGEYVARELNIDSLILEDSSEGNYHATQTQVEEGSE